MFLETCSFSRLPGTQNLLARTFPTVRLMSQDCTPITHQTPYWNREHIARTSNRLLEWAQLTPVLVSKIILCGPKVICFFILTSVAMLYPEALPLSYLARLRTELHQGLFTELSVHSSNLISQHRTWGEGIPVSDSSTVLTKLPSLPCWVALRARDKGKDRRRCPFRCGFVERSLCRNT